MFMIPSEMAEHLFTTNALAARIHDEQIIHITPGDIQRLSVQAGCLVMFLASRHQGADFERARILMGALTEARRWNVNHLFARRWNAFLDSLEFAGIYPTGVEKR